MKTIDSKLTRSIRSLMLAGLSTALMAGSIAQAAVLPVGSFTSSGDGTSGLWGTLQTITVGGTTYSSLNAGTVSGVSTSATNPKLGTGTIPANGIAAIGGNDLDTGALNAGFTIQFGSTVTTSDLFYFFETNSGADTGSSNDVSIQAINSVGGSVGSAFVIDDISLISGQPTIAGRDWNREGGTTLSGRQTNSITWSLADMGLGGATNVTGFTLSTANADSVAAGLASVPEPSTYALLAGFGALALVMIRRRLRIED